jgi:hypothetical protein
MARQSLIGTIGRKHQHHHHLYLYPPTWHHHHHHHRHQGGSITNWSILVLSAAIVPKLHGVDCIFAAALVTSLPVITTNTLHRLANMATPGSSYNSYVWQQVGDSTYSS